MANHDDFIMYIWFLEGMQFYPKGMDQSGGVNESEIVEISKKENEEEEWEEDEDEDEESGEEGSDENKD